MPSEHQTIDSDVRVVATDDGWAVEVEGDTASWHAHRFSAEVAAGSLARSRSGHALTRRADGGRRGEHRPRS